MISSNPVPKHAKAKLKSGIRISFFAVLASWRDKLCWSCSVEHFKGKNLIVP